MLAGGPELSPWLIELSQTPISISELRASVQPLTYAQNQLLERLHSFHSFRSQGQVD